MKKTFLLGLAVLITCSLSTVVVIKQVYFIKDRLIFYRELVDGENYHKLIIIN
ncbi:hypothetical protein [Clostridium tetani]|uniref:hypothetical protein n=1 Tax=Clostridium tetani TaxID=1513 RepID=UPI0002D40CDD|nr:hypothetical protein [Clostridium tetani]BDR65768.1 hypothetical protein K134307016_p10790 [Clostridium tetani]CDI50898.1 hypothetical protein BN906_02949 [Clostridium tetani 12124569]